jgi:hypothetical protein
MKKLLLSLLAVFLVTVMSAQLNTKPLLLYLSFNNEEDIAYNMQGKTADTANAIYTADGKFLGGASFEGSEFIVMDAYDTLNCTSDFSWSFWFKTTEEGGSLVQWGHWSGTPAAPNGDLEDEETGNDPHWPGDVTIWTGYIPGGISYDVGYVGMTDLGEEVLVNDGEWHHFVISCTIGDPTVEKFYLDGVLITEDEVGAGFIDEDDAEYNIKIGYSSSSWPTNGDETVQLPYFTGTIDDFRIYGAALNDYDVLELFALEPNAVNALNAGQDFSVFPNPSSDYITVKSKHMRDLEIFNTIGQPVLRKKNVSDGSTINISGLDKGIYLLKSGDYTQKLIVK